MPIYQQHPDGSWGPAVPLDYAPGYDAEISRLGDWQLYRDGDHLVETGRHLTKFWRSFAIWRAVRRDQTRRNRGCR
jgi:hypothetical protein